MRRAESVIVGMVVVLAAVAAAVVHRRLPWISPAYLCALVASLVGLWLVTRRTTWNRRWKWSAVGFIALVLVSLLPVPWMKMRLEHPPGSAWRLDGQLVINGSIVDPPGTWYWLTAGRPPLVAEVVRGWFVDDSPAPASMLNGPRRHRPAVIEPVAAAVGLRRAALPIGAGVTVEVSEPIAAGLPARAVLSKVNGRELSTRTSWEAAAAALGGRNTFTIAGGGRYEFDGPVLPFGRIDLIDSPDDGLDVTVGGRFARTVPGSWFRQLSLGPSHGLMVALISYADASGDDLGAGRTIAGTGKIGGDGAVGRISGLRAKAAAARHVGADVLLFPFSQQDDLDGFETGGMRLCPVASLDDAIAALADTGDGPAC